MPDDEIPAPDVDISGSGDEVPMPDEGIPTPDALSKNQPSEAEVSDFPAERSTEESSAFPDGESLPAQKQELTPLPEKNPLPEYAEAEDPEDLAEAAKQESIYIQNAGLILVSKLLKAAFKNLGYLQDQEDVWVDKEKQERAVHFLYHFTTGAQHPAEQDLILNKIMVGWPLPEPITQELELTPEEKEVAEELAQFVISKWNGMTNMSVEAFRKSWMMREGRLTFDEERQRWYLNVERQGRDNLLLQFPYTYGEFAPKWTTNVVHTTW